MTLTERVIGCAIEVHRTMGPGLIESINRECMFWEFQARSLPFECERRLPIAYKGNPLRTHLRIDLLVDRRLVVELKAVDSLHAIHQAQVIAYLKLTGVPAGLLINFNEVTLRSGIRRLDHPEVYARKRLHRDGK